MKLTNLTIKNLFADNEKLTFLTGAGCSVDEPSCLPAGKKMMEAIINYTCAELEVEKLLKLMELGKLRFEALVEIVRDTLDSELKIIDYYGECDKPNIQHFFFADMIKKGHFVITTNFDFLIEYALQQSGVPNNDIIPVITKSDFEEFNNPYKLFKKGKKTVYKIHGSSKNVITGENTRDSLIATIQALGLNKEGLNVFQVEPFKRPLFDNISNGCSLVVIGYSGSDDFDVVPTLKLLQNLRNIIWINYNPDDGGKEKIYEIDETILNETEKLEKVNQVLIDIYRMHNANHVYKVDANTTKLLEKLLETKPKVSQNNFSVRSFDWFKEKVKEVNQFVKFFIPFKIFSNFGMYDDALRCSNEMLQIAKKTKNLNWEAIAFNAIGILNDGKGNYEESLKSFKKGLEISEKLKDNSVDIDILTNMAGAFNNLGYYSEALKIYDTVLKNIKKSGGASYELGAIIFLQSGYTYKALGNYNEALKKYKESLKIYEKLGALLQKATVLHSIAEIYKDQGRYADALRNYEIALDINEKLGNLLEKASNLNNIGEVYRAQGFYQKALNMFNLALEIINRFRDFRRKAPILNNIGIIYKTQKKYKEALEMYEEALEIDNQLNIISKKASYHNNIGEIYLLQGKTLEALKKFEKALEIDEKLGDIPGKAIDLNNIATIQFNQGNYIGALKKFEEALKIDKQLGDLPGKATRYFWIGLTYFQIKNYQEAFNYLRQAEKIYKKLGLKENEEEVKTFINKVFLIKKL